jgi:hypothetical protein
MADDEPTVGRWTVDASVLQVPPGPPIACRTLLMSLPPAGGSGVEVGGMDPRSVLGTTVYDNGTTHTPGLRLTGTYDGHRLTLTEPPVPAPAPTPPELAGESLGTACANPGEGHYTHEQRETAIAYAQAQPDLGTVWYSEAMRVLNISFTTNLDHHRQALRAMYPGPLCVVRARIAKAELDAVQRHVHTDQDFLQKHRIQLLGSGHNMESLHVEVVAASPAQIQLLHDRYGPLVVVTSWLQPAQPDYP